MNLLLSLTLKQVLSFLPVFEDNIYVQNGGVAMASPLGPILANIFMVELEQSVMPTLMDKVKCWTRFIHDTLCYIKTYSINYVLKVLNGFQLKQIRKSPS